MENFANSSGPRYFLERDEVVFDEERRDGSTRRADRDEHEHEHEQGSSAETKPDHVE